MSDFPNKSELNTSIIGVLVTFQRVTCNGSLSCLRITLVISLILEKITISKSMFSSISHCYCALEG